MEKFRAILFTFRRLNNFRKVPLKLKFSTTTTTSSTGTLENAAKFKKSDADDFLSNHGGKVALFGLVTEIGLIYRWVIGGRNRTNTEKMISEEYALIPLEVSEIRYLNDITISEFENIVTTTRSQFKSNSTNYLNFIEIFKSMISTSVFDGHLIDRIILFYNKKHQNTNIELELQKPISIMTYFNAIVPLDFLLVTSSMAVKSNIDERVACFYKLCKGMGNNKTSTSEEGTDGQYTTTNNPINPIRI